jgi:hypothetical protein
LIVPVEIVQGRIFDTDLDLGIVSDNLLLSEQGTSNSWCLLEKEIVIAAAYTKDAPFVMAAQI